MLKSSGGIARRTGEVWSGHHVNEFGQVFKIGVYSTDPPATFSGLVWCKRKDASIY